MLGNILQQDMSISDCYYVLGEIRGKCIYKLHQWVFEYFFARYFKMC